MTPRLIRQFYRTLKLRPPSTPYLSGDTFRTLATHILDETSNFNPIAVQARDRIFVAGPYLERFFANYQPDITQPYVLITHNGDQNITGAYTGHIDHLLLAWFAQNVLVEHEKIHAIPIGLENKYLYLHGIPRHFESLRARPVEKKTQILYKFSIATNPGVRGAALTILDSHDCAVTYIDWRTALPYLTTLQESAFVASPVGNGEDCIRTWEALYLGTIPIVTRSPLTTQFAALGLPLLLIDTWEDLKDFNRERLAEEYVKMAPKFNNPALWFNYWQQIITTSS
jgi:hypothetical protein